MASELIALDIETLRCDDPKLCVCYARGSIFKREGSFFRVEKGARSIVHRALCLSQHYGSRCGICPNRSIKIELTVQKVPDQEDP